MNKNKTIVAVVCTDLIYCPEFDLQLVKGINCPEHGLVGAEFVELV